MKLKQKHKPYIFMGYVIKPVYNACAKVAYYEALDPMEGCHKWIAGDTWQELEEDIKRHYAQMSTMPDNRLESWEALDGYDPEMFKIVDIKDVLHDAIIEAKADRERCIELKRMK